MSHSYEDLFYQALRIRLVEEKIVELYPTDRIQSPVHLSIGQEHHVAALSANMKREDQIFSSYRCHAVYLTRGGDLGKMFAELYGKSTGPSKGKAGSMHLCAPEVAMYGSSAIVGATLPHAMGMAYANKIKKNGRITLSVTGEGSMEEGVFHECMNFSALKSIPVLYVIENNGLAIHSRLFERQAFNRKRLTEAYGVSYFYLENGYDLKAGDELCGKAIEYVRGKCMPAVLEIQTYRYLQHVGIGQDHDKGYREQKDCDAWRAKDPLILGDDLVKKFTPAILKEIESAVKFAEASPFPTSDELLKDVR